MEAEFDLEQLDEMTDGDPELKKDIVEAFFECGDECLEELEQSLGGENIMWKEKAHALKGIALNFGATRVAKLSAEAEEGCEMSTAEKEKFFVDIQEAYQSAKNYFL